VAFSEAARFRDFLAVLEKINEGNAPSAPKNPEPPCALVYLKRRLNELSLDDAAAIAQRIKNLPEGQPLDDDDCSVVWLPQESVRVGDARFQFHMALSHPQTAVTLLEFLQALREKAGDKLTALTEVVAITRGLKPAQKGAIKVIYAVRPLHPNRLRQSPLVIERETSKAIIVHFARRQLTIPRNAVRPGVKTHAYLPTMDITDTCDWFICQPFQGFDFVELVLGTKVDFDALNRQAQTKEAHLVVGYRLDLAAPGTQLLAFFSRQKVVPQQALSSLLADPATAKALCLWLNGIAFLVQILANRAETRGSFCNLTDDMLRQTLAPTTEFLAAHRQSFARAFQRFSKVRWRSLLEQLEAGDKERYELDRFLLKLLGFTDGELDRWLPQVYGAMAGELRSLKEGCERADPKKTRKMTDALSKVPPHERGGRAATCPSFARPAIFSVWVHRTVLWAWGWDDQWAFFKSQNRSWACFGGLGRRGLGRLWSWRAWFGNRNTMGRRHRTMLSFWWGRRFRSGEIPVCYRHDHQHDDDDRDGYARWHLTLHD
jgi:hypothetical protein